MADSGSEIGPTLPPRMSRERREDTRQDGRPTAHRTENSDDYMITGPALPPGMGRESSSIGQDREDDDESIGPALPPHLSRRCNEDVRDEESSQRVPALTPNDRNRQSPALAGPRLPPGFATDQDIEEEEEEDIYGPALPPGFTTKPDSSEKPADITVGPALPPGFRKVVAEKDSEDEDSGKDEDSEDESSEEEMIGPMPPTEHDFVHEQSAAEALEARALAMKNKLTGKDEDVEPSRDTWMTELPEFSKDFGMGARTFRKNARPDKQDRSGWTETPADRARKHQERMEKAAAAEMRSSTSTSKEKKKKKKKKERQETKLSERDKRMGQEVSKHNQSVRPESLMDMHTKKRKHKLEEDSQEQERRPFDRENDLQVNRFDDARRKQLLKKSAHLGDKFSHSNEKMYL